MTGFVRHDGPIPMVVGTPRSGTFTDDAGTFIGGVAPDDSGTSADSNGDGAETVSGLEDGGYADVHAACAASRDVFFAHVFPNPNPIRPAGCHEPNGS